MAQQPPVGQGLLDIKEILSHSYTSQSVGLLWMSTPVGRGDLYLTTDNNHNRHQCSPVGFEPIIPASERPQTHALDRAATGIGTSLSTDQNFLSSSRIASSCSYIPNFGILSIWIKGWCKFSLHCRGSLAGIVISLWDWRLGNFLTIPSSGKRLVSSLYCPVRQRSASSLLSVGTKIHSLGVKAEEA